MPVVQPPRTVVVGDSDRHQPGGPTGPVSRKTHIEVCVRLRPLAIGQTPSNSFFEGQQRRTQTRKPQIPRGPRSPSRLQGPSSRIGGGGQSATPAAAPNNNCRNIYAWNVVSSDTVRQSPSTDIVQGRTHEYTVDRVYSPDTDTKYLYDNSVKELVQGALDGYHTAILAYGQTSTGKTHTMSGTSQEPGLIPLAIHECFNYLQRIENQPREYLLRISYLEVYKEHIRDLLAKSAAAPPVRLFDSADGLVIKGLHEEVVTSPEQVFRILAQGEARRQVGSTQMNQHSSRSHVIVRLWIESRTVSSSSSPHQHSMSSPTMSSASSLSSDFARQGCRVSSLSLVDLAGSESVKLSGSGERRSEGQYINKSLMTLGQVVYSLSEGKDSKKHVPYRDSKLTRLLQPSLSGNAQVVLICCISPLESHIEESHNTFKFATRAKKIQQKATIQESFDDKTLLQTYREEIEELKQQLKDAKATQEHLSQARTSTSTLPTISDMVDEDEISELVKSIRTMEKLILKSRPAPTPSQPEDWLDASDQEDDIDTWDDEEGLLALVSSNSQSAMTPPRGLLPTATPAKTAAIDLDNGLHDELKRVQGLLGSVMKKKQAKTQLNEQEVTKLRAQLEQQEVASSLRKADASFLQKQLEGRDDLLQEVSKILEAMEQNQVKLEEENAALRHEIARLQQRQGVTITHI